MIIPQTLKGFRDFLPEKMLKREAVLTKLEHVFKLFGFDPLETPAIEYSETLLGKYGDEADKLLYRFKDRGEREVGLRYDQTVPFARVVSQYKNELTFPFKRYQIQPVWRAEKPQKGRFREFLQCDLDIAGSSSTLADAEILLTSFNALKELGFSDVQILINDRTIFDKLNLSKKQIIILDKLEKIGVEKVILELSELGTKDALMVLNDLRNASPTPRLLKIFNHLTDSGLTQNRDFIFQSTLARGLDYYTSTIFEIKISNYSAGSVAGGGRYDNLMNQFIQEDVPSVGIAFGFDRIIEAMEENHLLMGNKTNTQVLISSLDNTSVSYSYKIADVLRKESISCEIYLDPDVKLEKKIKFADKKGIPYVVILGSEEEKTNTVTLKTLKNRTQIRIPIHELARDLQDS